MQMWGKIFSFQYTGLNWKLRFFSKAIPHFCKHIPLVEELQRQRYKKRDIGYIVSFLSSTGQYILLPLHRKSSSPITKNESDESMRIEGPRLHGCEHSDHGKGRKGERVQLFSFLVFTFQILERIKEVLEKVPGGTTPNVLNYYSEHSLTIKNMLRWTQSLVDINQRHIFSRMNRRKKPQLGHLCSSWFFSLGEYCFKLLFVLIID